MKGGDKWKSGDLKLEKFIRSFIKRSYETLPVRTRNRAREVVPSVLWRSAAEYVKSPTSADANPLDGERRENVATCVSEAAARPSASTNDLKAEASLPSEVPERSKKLRSTPTSTYWHAHDFPESSRISLELMGLNQDVAAADFLIALESLNGRSTVGRADASFQLGPGWHYSTSLRTYYQYLPAAKRGMSCTLDPLDLDEPVSSVTFSLRQWTRSDVPATDVCEILALHISPLSNGVDVTVLPSAKA